MNWEIFRFVPDTPHGVKNAVQKEVTTNRTEKYTQNCHPMHWNASNCEAEKNGIEQKIK